MQLHKCMGPLAHRQDTAATAACLAQDCGGLHACADVAAASAVGCHTAFVLWCGVYNKCIIYAG